MKTQAEYIAAAQRLYSQCSRKLCPEELRQLLEVMRKSAGQ